MNMIKKLLRTALVMILISVILSSCAFVPEKDNQNPEEEYRQILEEMGYSKREDVVAVTPITRLPKDEEEFAENRWQNASMHPFGGFIGLYGLTVPYEYEETEIYQKSSEVAIVIATKISSETFVKDNGIFVNDDQEVIRDKRIVTVTKMRVDEIPETIKTSGNTLKVGDFFYVLEYRGEYSLKDEIYYENGLPYAINATQYGVDYLTKDEASPYFDALASEINGSEYRAIADGQSICFLNLDDDPIIVSGYEGGDEFNGWWDCTSISIEKRTYSINDPRYDLTVIEMIEKYAWHLLDK